MRAENGGVEYEDMLDNTAGYLCSWFTEEPSKNKLSVTIAERETHALPTLKQQRYVHSHMYWAYFTRQFSERILLIYFENIKITVEHNK